VSFGGGYALGWESMSQLLRRDGSRFVNFMTRAALERALPRKSVAEASDCRKTRREYRKNTIIASHCAKLRTAASTLASAIINR
jgi:hypothetical protein